MEKFFLATNSFKEYIAYNFRLEVESQKEPAVYFNLTYHARKILILISQFQ